MTRDGQRAVLVAVRSQALAMLAQVDVALSLIEAEDAAAKQQAAAACAHVRTVGTAVGGDPTRKKCLDCGASITAAPVAATGGTA